MLASYKALKEKAWKCLEIHSSHRTLIKWINITHNRQTEFSKWCVNYFLMLRTKGEVDTWINNDSMWMSGLNAVSPSCLCQWPGLSERSLVLRPPRLFLTVDWLFSFTLCGPHWSAAHQRTSRLPGSDCCSQRLQHGAHWCYSFIQKQLAAHNPSLWVEKMPTILHTVAVMKLFLHVLVGNRECESKGMVTADRLSNEI